MLRSQWFTSPEGDWKTTMATALNNHRVSEVATVQIPAGWFAENVRPWLGAAQSTVAVLTYREALRLLILAKQLGW